MGKLLENLRRKHAADRPTAGRHTVNFLAHRNDIAEAVREGWTAKQIWEQMSEDGMTAMSYATFCRLVKKHITSSAANMDSTAPSADTPMPASRASVKFRAKSQSNSPARKPTEKERLDLLKEEAFKAARPPKPTGPLISKPKSREEENRELFG